eukprot:298607-Prorocentrum_lima.AAC.1
MKLAPMIMREHSSNVPKGLCDMRAGVYFLCGHLKCDWQHTLMNAQNRSNFKSHTMDSLSGKGIYPLKSNDWWLAQPVGFSAPTGVFSSRNWIR